LEGNGGRIRLFSNLDNFDSKRYHFYQYKLLRKSKNLSIIGQI